MGFVKFITKIAKCINYLPMVACVGMMLLVVANCILRRFGLPILATYDLACFILILIVAPAIAYCESEKGHIYLEIVTEKLPKKVQDIISIIVNVMCTAFCGMCTYGLFERTGRFIDSGQTGLSIDIPVWPFILVEAISMGVCCLVYLANIVEDIIKIKGLSNNTENGKKEEQQA